ncbi:hypothetical protein ANN_14220 [Periplaneta americana]|uniref:DDE-1 domain-containing protein n=1 Tax=Periplaneta americana TaxID=6978 RepID=A0ABQ8SVQ4_PERAM|nr:hypothetical protein ANN_14220 [Periplaneta americana]
MKEFRRLAYQLAERNGCKHPFNNNTGMAGEDWGLGFIARHPDLSMRKPEGTSGARAMGFNKVAVSQIFALLTHVIDENKLTGAQIYNCDETGMTVVPKLHSKIIATKGQRQVGVLTSAERGNTVTVEICCSAAGNFMPPMLIYPRKRKQQEYEVGLPSGGWAERQKERPVLLLLDGHASHTKSLDVTDLARNNGVILLCFPPHCSHRLQPLDVAFMRPLSLYYEDEVRRCLRSNPGKVVTLWQVSTFRTGFHKRCEHENCAKRVRKGKLWPTNINVFSDDDFLPAATTDIQIADRELPAMNQEILETERANDIPIVLSSVRPVELTTSVDEPQPLCSGMPDTPTHRPNSLNSSFPSHSTGNAIPVPKVEIGQRRVARKRGKTAILTTSPYKAQLQEAQKTKEVKQTKVKRKLLDQEKIGNSEKQSRPKPKKVRKTAEEKVEETECFYCNELYSTSNEGWVSCVKCKQWAHNSCAGYVRAWFLSEAIKALYHDFLFMRELINYQDIDPQISKVAANKFPTISGTWFPELSLPSKETLRGHSDSSFRREGYIQCCVGVRLCDMYSNQELAEIHFMYGKADGNAALARRLYQERYPQRQCPDRKTFVRLHYRLCDYVKFNSPGLGRGRPRYTTPEVQEEILEAVNMTPFYISTRRVVLQVNVPHTTVWRLLKEYRINCILIICNVYRPCHQQITLHELGSVSGSCSSVV